jgi:hypothetical protein
VPPGGTRAYPRHGGGKTIKHSGFGKRRGPVCPCADSRMLI